jgi:hypothetical protein
MSLMILESQMSVWVAPLALLACHAALTQLSRTLSPGIQMDIHLCLVGIHWIPFVFLSHRPQSPAHHDRHHRQFPTWTPPPHGDRLQGNPKAAMTDLKRARVPKLHASRRRGLHLTPRTHAPRTAVHWPYDPLGTSTTPGLSH